MTTATLGAERQSPASVFGYVWQVSARQQVWLVLLACLIFPLTMAPLELQRHIVDDAIGGESIRHLLIFGGLYLAVVLLQGGLKLALRVYRGWVSEGAIRRMRRRLADLTVGDARNTKQRRFDEGELIPMVAAEVERVGGFVGPSLSEPVLQAGILLSVLGYMLVVEPKVALVSFGIFVPQLILVPLIQRVLNRRAATKVQMVRELGERIVDQEPYVNHGDHQDNIEQIFRNRMSYYRWKFFLKFLTNLLNHLGPLSVLMVGGYFVIQGQTTIGTVVAFISGFERMADPARQLLAHYRLASESQVKYRLLADRLEL